MLDQYLTAQETSEYWGVDARTVQGLCRKGKIEGAVKRAGSWFIPKDAPVPLKKNNANSRDLQFVGTKRRVFSNAIELFAERGFESVSMKDIADAVQITQSAIYNHFPSKQALLDAIYDYYIEHYKDNRKPAQTVKDILMDSTRDDICLALMFTFETEDSDRYRWMIWTTKIILMRIFQDERARYIFNDLMNHDNEEYLEEILQYGVSQGVFEKFDTTTYAKLLIGQRLFMGVRVFIDPDYAPRQLEEEAGLFKMCAGIIPFAAKPLPEKTTDAARK